MTQRHSSMQEEVMSIVIGIDPHPQHHVAAALDDRGGVGELQTFPNSTAGLEAFLEWVHGFSNVQVAVEGPTQPFFASWLTRLLVEEVSVVAVSAQSVHQRRARRKTDAEDAVLVARVCQAEPSLPAVNPPPWLRPLQELTRTRSHLARQLQADRMRLRSIQSPIVQASLHEIVHALEAQVASLDQAIASQVKTLAPRLLKLAGVGTVIAGVLLAETGDILRFRTKHHFATYCGTAPVPWESGGSKRVRVNRSGNRRLNWALHLIARTRLRIDGATKALVARKEQEGKTHREALRVLKNHLALQLYGTLRDSLPRTPTTAMS